MGVSDIISDDRKPEESKQSANDSVRIFHLGVNLASDDEDAQDEDHRDGDDSEAAIVKENPDQAELCAVF